MDKTADVSIIGAGIMGCSTAFQLARRGLRVAVFEKSTLGQGSSGKSSAIIRQHYSNEVTARMALHSLRIYQNFRQEVGGECGFKETGILLLTTNKDVEGLKANVALQQSVGIRTEVIDREAILEIMPALEVSDLVAAAYEPQSGYADPNLTLNSYAEAATRHGAKIYLETPVEGIRMKSGRVLGVNTTKGSVASSIVINCAGSWGARVARLAHVDLPINSCRVQVGFFRRPEGFEAPHPVIADFVHGVYWRPETGNLTLIGLIDPEEEKAVVDPDNYNQNVEVDFMAAAGERLVRRFPAMEQSQATGGYAALYGITPDWHPVIDQLIPDSGLYCCAGFSGHGFKLGPAVGLMTAHMVTGEETPEMSRHMFRLSRYAENDPVRGRYAYSIVG